MNTIKLNIIGTPCKAGGSGNNGDSTGGGGSDWRYFKATQDVTHLGTLAKAFGFLSKLKNGWIGASGHPTINEQDVVAVGVDMKARISCDGETPYGTIEEEVFIKQGLFDIYASLGVIEITESEFYTL